MIRSDDVRREVIRWRMHGKTEMTYVELIETNDRNLFEKKMLIAVNVDTLSTEMKTKARMAG